MKIALPVKVVVVILFNSTAKFPESPNPVKFNEPVPLIVFESDIEASITKDTPVLIVCG